jgi:predicted nucleic acid-binding protein
VLYVDSSALSKQYLQEVGSARLGARLEEAARRRTPVLTSFLTYAEIHTMLGRKLREGSLLSAELRTSSLAQRQSTNSSSYLIPRSPEPRALPKTPAIT